VIQLTVETSRKRVPVIGGTGANATTEAMELHSFAKKIGCDACLSVNPITTSPARRGCTGIS